MVIKYPDSKSLVIKRMTNQAKTVPAIKKIKFLDIDNPPFRFSAPQLCPLIIRYNEKILLICNISPNQIILWNLMVTYSFSKRRALLVRVFIFGQ